MRKSAIAFATVATVLGTASPAWADKGGTKYCPGYATARSQYFGSLYLKGPGDSSYQYFYSPGVWRTDSNQGNPDGYWHMFVSGNSAYIDSQTYAFCNSGGS